VPSEPPDGRHLRSFVQKLSENLVRGCKADYDLGAQIEEVLTGTYWKHWPRAGGEAGFASFEEWCYVVLGFKDRKAFYLKKNYTALAAMHLAEDTITRALRLGWAKLSHVVRVAKDEHSLLRWIDHIEDNEISENDLRKQVALALSNGVPGESAAGGGEAGPANVDPDDKPERIPWKMVFTSKDDFNIFKRATGAIRKRFDPHMGDGKAVALMATSYLAALPRMEEGGTAQELADILHSLEHTFGVRLAPVDASPLPPPRRARDEGPAPVAQAPAVLPAAYVPTPAALNDF
jgi:hypothetical protein